tara:strand:+ start:80 stop:1408 length:1329 start_codon:yes stop_codon:yes gene_type:complete
MSNFDLDIKNYNINDIEKFFKLKKGYTINDVELKEYEIRQILFTSDNINKEMKRDVIVFCTAAKQWLLYSKFGENAIEPLSKNDKRGPSDREFFQFPPTTIPKYDALDPINIPVALTQDIAKKTSEVIYQDGKSYVYSAPGEYFKGDLNPLNNRIINRCLSIDTKFRDNYESTKSTDFSIQLPEKINKVVEMHLTKIEFPISFYNICESYGNNYLFLYLNEVENDEGKSKEYTLIITIPDGVYTATALIDKINELLVASESLFSNIIFSIDLDSEGNGTGKTKIDMNDDASSSINMIGLDFTRNNEGLVDQSDFKKRIGWNLGFISKRYFGKKSYVSDAVIDVKTIKYIYLAINDYQKAVNNIFIEAFHNRSINENIIGRVSMNSEDFTILMKNLITEPRRYFGPVDIQRLRVQLYDDFGRILDLNKSDFSFVLNLKVLYDI